MEYPKIHSLWKREGWYFEEGKKNSPGYQKGRQSFIIGDYAEPEFGAIKTWFVDEKVDGTNIRIMYRNGKVEFGGRTADALIPARLLNYLQETLTPRELHRVFPCDEGEPYPSVTLFGEGYGPKIQKGGGNYRSDQAFILFDVVVGGWWLKREDVHDIAVKFSIPITPLIGLMTEEEIVKFVKSQPPSLCSDTMQVMEGVVCRSHPLMLFRNGKPIMWKLKCKEF